MSWGSDTNNESKPNWTWLTAPGRNGAPPKSANVFATGRGWVHRWPWGDEVLVAIGGLDTNLGNASIDALHVLTPEVANVANRTLEVLVLFNEGVTVNGTPTISAIGTDLANVTLSYSSAKSDPSAGRLVFHNTDVDVDTAVDGEVGSLLTVNSTSVLSGWAGIADDDDANNVVANSIPSGVSASATVVTEKPFNYSTVPLGEAVADEGQLLSFALVFNRALVVNTVPTIEALSANTDKHADVVLELDGPASNLEAGILIFTSEPQDFSALTENLVFTVNSSSTLTGFDGIADVNGNVAANVVSTANTFTVVVE